MRIIICGAGQVGYGIARQLAAEQNDITVIDWREDLIRQMQDSLDVRALVGHGSHPDVLDRAGAGEADMLIAVTYSDEVNMIASQIAHSLFSVPIKIARVRAQSYLDPIWQDLFSRDHLPIDVIISPELEVGRSIMRRLDVPGAFESIDFANGAVQLIGVRLEEGAPIANTPLRQIRDLFPDLATTVVGIARGERVFVPKPDDQAFSGDEVYFVASRDHVQRTLEICGHEETEARKVIIVGGGNIGLYVASELERREERRVRVRLVEHDKERAEEAAERLERTVVLHGSGLDQTLLKEAGVAETETLLALTNDDEVNILASLMAKKAGTERVITLLNNQDYGPLVRSLDIDAFLDPRATTVSTILQHVRRGRIKSLHAIKGGAAEATEAEALETSPLVGRPLGEVHLPDGIVVGAVVRGEEVLVLGPQSEIQPSDRVIMFAERDMRQKVEQLFRVSLEYF